MSEANTLWFPFDGNEITGLFWVCATTFNSYHHYRKFRHLENKYQNVKNAPIIGSISSNEYRKGHSHSIPYATITGEVYRSHETLMSSDNKTSGVIRIVQEHTEGVLYTPLLMKLCVKGKVNTTSFASRFQLHNRENWTDFNIIPPTAESIVGLEQMLPVVLYSVIPDYEECFLHWIVEMLPSCSLLFRNVIKEKMLPMNATATIMGKILIGKDGQLSVLDPQNPATPYIISVLSSQEILKQFRLNYTKELANTTYFGSLAIGLTVMLLIELYRQSKGKPRMFGYNKRINLYFSFIIFTTWLPTFVGQYLLNMN